MNGAIILLAAGASSRLGQSKQLLSFGDTTLLEHAVHVAIQCKASRTIVVLGANFESHRSAIQKFPIEIIFNQQWQQGIGASIKSGVAHLNNSQLDYAIIMVCDQPFLTEHHIKNLVSKFKEGASLIVASSYSNVLGAPALFDKSLFPELLTLEAHQGAKKIIQKYSNKTVFVDFPGGAMDIDTPVDYEKLISLIQTKKPST